MAVSLPLRRCHITPLRAATQACERACYTFVALRAYAQRAAVYVARERCRHDAARVPFSICAAFAVADTRAVANEMRMI
jgi:hypothetical protein